MQDLTVFAAQISRPGRLACLDLGEKRIGVAVSDASQMVASPRAVWSRSTGKALQADLHQLCQSEALVGLVIGLPQTLAGQDSKQTQRVRAMTRNITEWVAPLPVTFWDERMSSKQATFALEQVGIRKKKQRDKVDASAAAYILQGVLDYLAHNQPEPQP